METNPYTQRLDAARQLLELFKMDRTMYLVVNVVVLVFLIGYGIYSAITSGGDMAVIVAFFGMTGVVTFTTGKLLRIWSQVFTTVMGTDPDPDPDPPVLPDGEPT